MSSAGAHRMLPSIGERTGDGDTSHIPLRGIFKLLKDGSSLEILSQISRPLRK